MEYKDLNVWIESRKLVAAVYSLTKTFPKSELFCLVHQVNRAAISIPSNIAEACGRNHSKILCSFYM